ncbi:MAG: hypothetical protein JO025_17960 [Verrucomicrobia bacterium]|nr:hypothetical protein [Verrucomicrobiota bacterium]
MKNQVVGDSIVSDNEYCSSLVLILPLIALAMLTGCSTLGSAASGEPAPTTTDKTYLEQNSSTSDQVVDTPDPGYEWFY